MNPELIESVVATEVIKIISFPDGRMDAENAGRYLGLSPKTLAMMRCEGTGPVYLKRGKIFYFKEKLDEWLLEGERTKPKPNKRKKSNSSVS